MNSVRFLCSPRDTRGFAVPAAIFVIIVVSLLALGGLYVAQNDAKANTGIRRSWKAFNAANAGATRTVAVWDRPTYGALNPGDSVIGNWQTLPDGSQYRTTVLRADDGQAGSPTLYRLRTVGRPGPGVTAQRSIVTLVGTISTSGVCCDGAVKAQGRLSVQGTGNKAKADGRDIPPASWSGTCSGPTSDLPGIVIQDVGDLTETGNPKIYGSPPVQADGSINDEDFAIYDELVSMADKQLAGGNLSPQAVTSGGACVTSDATNWGDPLNPGTPCSDYLPIIHITGNAKLIGNGYGQGILLVDGNLDITGNFDFYGVIIVMGEADFGGTPYVYGGVMVRNGPGGTGQSRLRGNEGVHYSSCVINRALTQASVARPLSGRHWFEVLE